VNVNKRALIITDGTEAIQSIAQTISGVLDGFTVKMCTAEKFAGTDLLAVDLFFIGCEKSCPSSFAYLEDLLSHINLASRKCGVFSTKEKTLKYLRGIVKDSEADLTDPLSAPKGEVKKSVLKKWIKGILK